jgi:hypothetical protein
MSVHFRRFISGICLVLGVGLGASANAAAPASTPSQIPVATTPELLLPSFYSWYLGKIEDGDAPVVIDRKTLRRYVSSSRMKKLAEAYRSGSLDIDYFTKAQDVMEDWQNHVTVTDVAIDSRRASAVVALGAAADWRLKVFMIREQGRWRIDRVAGPDQRQVN